MPPTEIIIQGTLSLDGTLKLDEKPKLPPGRVEVVLRSAPIPVLPPDDPFLRRLQAIRSIPRSAGRSDDGGRDTLDEVRQAREEWEEHQTGLERLQEGT